ncbi:MAG: DUF4159 domain-containing protein [Deferribacteres bacterium]|nr:DUF4159 domain-containing protein [candidate division KSB1 bacterium]MCB9501425.1 DUF4159 domain-containing protein [Deferribacteres bacterium]
MKLIEHLMLSTKKIFVSSIFLLVTILIADQACMGQSWRRKSQPQLDKFTFVRVEWTPKIDVRYMRYFGGPVPPWAHDYPVAEQHMYYQLEKTAAIGATYIPQVFSLKDDDIFDFPLMYICEIGVWEPDPEEIVRLGEYLKRGGLLIVDDFRSPPEWYNFTKQMNKIVPAFKARKLRLSDPVFHCFFDLMEIPMDSPYLRDGYIPEFWGWFDPEGHLAAIVNYNNDIGDGWELPEDLGQFSFEAFELGINYIIYSMTH